MGHVRVQPVNIDLIGLFYEIPLQTRLQVIQYLPVGSHCVIHKFFPETFFVSAVYQEFAKTPTSTS